MKVSVRNQFAVGLVCTLSWLSLAAILAGCAPKPAGDFAIYLPAREMTVAQMTAADLSGIVLQDAPVISTADIAVYNWGAQEIRLTAAAFQRVMALKVPVRGLPFVACVDRKPVYWGAFWTPISSMSFEGVTIMLPFGSQDNAIEIGLGYPSADFFRGEDPRFNPEVRKALEQAGKLR